MLELDCENVRKRRKSRSIKSLAKSKFGRNTKRNIMPISRQFHIWTKRVFSCKINSIRYAGIAKKYNKEWRM